MFQGKSVIITGGSSGLGLALAKALAPAGTRLGLVSRDPHKLERAAVAVRATRPGAQVLTAAADVREEAAIAAAMDELGEKLGGIDVLFNCAGILREGPFDRLPMSAFREVMEVNYFGTLHATRTALPHLRRSRGRLVNVASVAGLTGVYGYAPYCSSKHALVGLSETLRVELKRDGVRVHVVCPPEFDSPMVEELDAYRTPENRAHTLTIPKSTVEEVAAATLKGLRQERFLIVTGAQARLVVFTIRHFPALSRWVGDRVIAKASRQAHGP